jgi:hypothetical protein
MRNVVATVLVLSLMSGTRLVAQHQLVTPADVERITGLKGVFPAPTARQVEGLQTFLRGADNQEVVFISVPVTGSHEAFLYTRNAMPTHEDVTGVGDEAFLTNEGRDLYIRKGEQEFVVRSGVDAAKLTAVVTPAQLKEIAKLVAARL